MRLAVTFLLLFFTFLSEMSKSKNSSLFYLNILFQKNKLNIPVKNPDFFIK